MERIEKIAPYLSHGVRCHFNMMGTVELSGIGREEDGQIKYFIHSKNSTLWYDSKDIIPILRPLSDLTKEIEVNGEKFVPMVRLKQITTGCLDDGELFLGDSGSVDYGVRKGDEYNDDCYYIEWETIVTIIESLSFKNKDFARCLILDRGKLNGVRGCSVDNQLMMFNKLFEWHFDVFGMIQSGEAVDINTI